MEGALFGTINQSDNEGLTPLHAAVRSGNLKLVKFLISYGAEVSINTPNAKGVTPLHSAVAMKDLKLVRVMLRYGGEKSIVAQDLRGVTPKLIAITTGQVSVVKTMLDYRPELAERLNESDHFRVTDLQRAARNGNMELMSLLLARYGKKGFTVNPEAFFTKSDLEACLEPVKLSLLKDCQSNRSPFR